MTTFYKQHLFVCTNQKAPGKTCCAVSGGEPFFEYLKKKVAHLQLAGQGNIRISKSGCLGRCDVGPCIVVYPEGLWYTYESFADIDEIVDGYLVSGVVVSRLVLPST